MKASTQVVTRTRKPIVPTATSKGNTNWLRCGHCKKYHPTKADVMVCSTAAFAAAMATTVTPSILPTTTNKKKGAPVTTKKAVTVKPAAVEVVAEVEDDEEGDADVRALPPTKASAGLKATMTLIQKPEKEDEGIVWALVAAIKMGRYDYWLVELDEVLSDRLEGMGYSFVDDTAPLRKAHKEATGKAPATKSKAVAKPSSLTTPIQLIDGQMTSDFVADTRPGTYVRRGTIVHTIARGAKWNDLWAEVLRDNQKSYSVRLLSGDDKGKRATLAKGICTPFRVVTAETAELKRDIKKGPKVNVKAELEAARAALADVDDTDNADDTPVRRVRKAKVKATPVAEAVAVPAAGKGKRRVMRRG